MRLTVAFLLGAVLAGPVSLARGQVPAPRLGTLPTFLDLAAMSRLIRVSGILHQLMHRSRLRSPLAAWPSSA